MGDKKSNKGKSPKTNISPLFGARPTQIAKTAKDAAVHPPVAPPNWKYVGFGCLAVLLACVVAHVNSLFGSPVFNDPNTLSFLQNIGVADSVWEQVAKQMVTAPLTAPWLLGSYASDFQINGLDFFWFHFVNLSLHVVTAIYLFGLVLQMAWRWKEQGRLAVDPYFLSAAAGLLFACHPLASESVAYVSARQAPLLGANYFLALNTFLFAYFAGSRWMRIWGLLATLMALWMGLATSVDALTLPITMLVLIALLKRSDATWGNWLSQNRGWLVSLILVSAFLPNLAFLGVQISPGNGVGTGAPDPAVYYASQLKAIPAYYLRSFLVPVGLTVDPAFATAASWADPFVWLGAAILAGSFAAMWLYRQVPAVVLGLYLFLIGMLPTSLVVQPELIADRRFYLPLSGLCIIVGWLYSKWFASARTLAASVFGAVLVVLIGLTIWHNTAFHNNPALWNAALQADPNSPRAHAMYALYLLRRNDAANAEAHAKLAIQYRSDFAPGYLASGGAALAKKDYSTAREQFEKALSLAEAQKLTPDFLNNSHAGLAESLIALNKPGEALMHANIVSQIDPNNGYFQYLTGASLLELDTRDRIKNRSGVGVKSDTNALKAFAMLRHATEMPGAPPDTTLKLGEAALRMHMTDDVVPIAKVALSACPGPDAEILAARALLAQGHAAEAQDLLNKVIPASPKNAAGLATMSIVQQELGRPEKASDYAKKAMALDPHAFEKTALVRVQDQPKKSSDKKDDRKQKLIEQQLKELQRNGGIDMPPGAETLPKPMSQPSM